jgi:hypothetical protein
MPMNGINPLRLSGADPRAEEGGARVLSFRALTVSEWYVL